MSISLSAARNPSPALRNGFSLAQPHSSHVCGEPRTLNDHLRSLRQYGSRLHYRRNETVFAEGEPADSVYKVINGTLRLCRFLADGRRHITDFVLSGDIMGFLECADQPATAEAVTDVTLMSYPRGCFDRLAASNPEIRACVLCHLSANLLEAQHQLLVMGCQSAKERVASFLLRLAERTDLQPGERLDLPMGRQDIGDHLGLTTETICRAISMLKSDGALSVPSPHELILKDLRALRALATES